MINTLRIYEELSQALEPKAAQKLASVLGAICEDLQQTVTKAEFNDLRQVVRDLAEAQKRTEARVEELAEAQKRTEARLEELAVRVDQLAAAQKRTEQALAQLTARVDRLTERVDQLAEQMTHLTARVDRLTERVDRLAEQMVHLTERVDRLTERVDRLTERVDQLAEQMIHLTERVDQLTARMDQLVQRVDHLDQRLDDTNRQLGGLTATVGYALENEAYRALPSLLERDHGLVLLEPLRRGWLTDVRGRDLEVNILGRGARAGEAVWVIGESKSQLSANEVDRFLQQRVALLEPVCGKVFPVLVTHMVTGKDVPDYARQRGVALYFSYEFNPVPAGR